MSEREPEGALTVVPRRGSYWLMSRHVQGRMELLTFSTLGEDVLPVFGHRKEVEEFLRPGEGGKPRETTIGELASILMGPQAKARQFCSTRGRAGTEMATEFTSMGKNEFLANVGDSFRLAGQRNPLPSFAPSPAGSNPVAPQSRLGTGSQKPGKAESPLERGKRMYDMVIHTNSGERFLAPEGYGGYALLNPLRQNIGSVKKVFVNGGSEPECARASVKAGFLKSKTVLIPVSFAEVDDFLCTITLR